MTVPHTAIVLLNWNGWQDTVACVSELLKLDDQDCVIVVCDNASRDDSWIEMQNWCRDNAAGSFEVWQPGKTWSGRSKITFIQTGANLGFAGGCNIGIRFALQQTDCDYVWLLNNDTEVSSSSLSNQVRRMRADSTVGLLGSTLVYDQNRAEVQCFGGYGFNFWNARVRPLPFGTDPQRTPAVPEVEGRLRYVSGASTFTSRRFLETIGLLNEQYFLYFEEIDWAVRRGPFRISYCPESVVFHKEGRSIGSAQSIDRRSRQSELWLTRNRILFMRTYFPWRVPITLFWVMMVAGVRFCTGRRELAMVLLQGIRNGLLATVQPLPDRAAWPSETPQCDEHSPVERGSATQRGVAR